MPITEHVYTAEGFNKPNLRGNTRARLAPLYLKTVRQGEKKPLRYGKIRAPWQGGEIAGPARCAAHRRHRARAAQPRAVQFSFTAEGAEEGC